MRRRRASGITAALLVLTLVGAPLASVVPAATCRACPPQCPMHRKGTLPCHEGGAHHGCGAHGAGVAAPSCGGATDAAAVALPPAVLPSPVTACALPATQPHRPRDVVPWVRAADPPDSPPPIAAA